MSEPAPDPAVTPNPDPLARELARLDPAPHGFDRDALMFAAGQASKYRALIVWRTVAALALLTAAVFAGLYFTRTSQTKIVAPPAIFRSQQ